MCCIAIASSHIPDTVDTDGPEKVLNRRIFYRCEIHLHETVQILYQYCLHESVLIFASLNVGMAFFSKARDYAPGFYHKNCAIPSTVEVFTQVRAKVEPHWSNILTYL